MKPLTSVKLHFKLHFVLLAYKFVYKINHTDRKLAWKVKQAVSWKQKDFLCEICALVDLFIHKLGFGNITMQSKPWNRTRSGWPAGIPLKWRAVETKGLGDKSPSPYILTACRSNGRAVKQKFALFFRQVRRRNLKNVSMAFFQDVPLLRQVCANTRWRFLFTRLEMLSN